MVPSFGGSKAQNGPLAQSKNALNNGVSLGEGILEVEVLVLPRCDFLSQFGVLGVSRQCKLKCLEEKFFHTVVLED